MLYLSEIIGNKVTMRLLNLVFSNGKTGQDIVPSYLSLEEYLVNIGYVLHPEIKPQDIIPCNNSALACRHKDRMYADDDYDIVEALNYQ